MSLLSEAVPGTVFPGRAVTGAVFSSVVSGVLNVSLMREEEALMFFSLVLWSKEQHLLLHLI